jgi:hypothetical protein
VVGFHRCDRLQMAHVDGGLTDGAGLLSIVEEAADLALAALDMTLRNMLLTT